MRPHYQRHPRFPLRRTPALAGVLVFGSVAPLPAQSLDALVERSPFAPPAASQPEAAPATGPQGPAGQRFTFRGVVRIGEAWQFSLFDREEARSQWVGLDETIGPYRIVEYEVESRRLTLASGGDTETLSLEESAPGGDTGIARPASVRERDDDEPRRIVPRRRVVRPIPRPDPEGRS